MLSWLKKLWAFKRIRPFWVLLPLLLAVVLLAMYKPKAKDPAPVEMPAVNVKVQKVIAVSELDDIFELPGVVEPDRVVKVAAEVAGRIERIEAEEGKPCKQGDKIVTLNTELLQAAYDRAKAAAEFDAREYERTASLADKGIAPPTELDQYLSKAAASKAAFNEAKATLERAVIVAPTAGILNCIPVEAGEYVAPGTQVAEIVAINKVKVVVDVPERDARFIRIGDKETLLAGPNGSAKLTGEVTYISELADNNTRTTRVEITVDNTGHVLRSGQVVTARISRGVLKDVVLIPLLAVIPLENGKEVYVAEGGKAQSRKVTLGFFRGSDVQVLPEGSELKVGDALIVAGHRFVAPGQPVNIEKD